VAIKVLGPYSSDEQRQIWLVDNGYDQFFVLRYFDWLANFVVGDFGTSIRFKVPVGDIMWPRLGNTGILALATMAVVVPVSLGLGVLAGMREGSRLDRGISVTSIVTTSIPEFASAPLLLTIFVFYLGVLPGTSSMTDGFDIVQLVLPVMVLVLYELHPHRDLEGLALQDRDHASRPEKRADRALYRDHAADQLGHRGGVLLCL
jgi:peptide/nickel transport system permease protein